jgi:hypothetical protein
VEISHARVFRQSCGVVGAEVRRRLGFRGQDVGATEGLLFCFWYVKILSQLVESMN